MGKQTWLALKSCKHQNHEEKDRLSQLPHDVLMSIMSLFTIKEAAQTSVLSRTWNYFWRCFPILVFKDDFPTLHFVARNPLLLPEGRSNFTTMVNSVIDSHRGLTIDKLRVIFDLDTSYESDIDKWLAFALAKQVKTLELNFTPQVGRKVPLACRYTWPLESRWLSRGLHLSLASITSLCLKFVNVTDKDIECILLSCHALESMRIVHGSFGLKNIIISQTSLQLKHLELSNCYLSCIDIKAPKLVSLTLHGRPISLIVRDSLLSKVSIGNGFYRGEVVASAYRNLSQYFTKLEYLSWHLCLCAFTRVNVKWNLGISKPPIMSNLKHLELHVRAKGKESLLGWAYLIEESPVLEKLTLKFSPYLLGCDVRVRNIVKRKGRPIKNLKTLQHFGYLGLPIDIEFATYVVENSINLKDVIFTYQFTRPFRDPFREYARSHVFEFIKTLPQEVAFRFGKPANHCCFISTAPYA
ncbi:F-box/FBD/LRR-repeat protein At5g53840-like isoform X2 [Amaranthus tricolor]|nr:F-box/FBD/LRR-repeat protein At5g53840-like isoform X2 [Amaranthus tricolor]XP_057525566.1 F-box/FBD/LRR-repeat protein At5g53840-like isoform X2 [Amaranthus tricolor]XP_057525567.1 F-box/FBD/LRR-repeat protein At5g53840-like isoform X2 [Amaranthus tricolor]